MLLVPLSTSGSSSIFLNIPSNQYYYPWGNWNSEIKEDVFFSSVSLFLSGWPGLYQKETYQRWFAFDKWQIQPVSLVNIPFWKKASVVVLNVTNWYLPTVKRPGPKAKKAIAASLLKPQKNDKLLRGIHESWRKRTLGRSYGLGTPCRRLLRTHLNHIRQKQMNSWHFLSIAFFMEEFWLTLPFFDQCDHCIWSNNL